MCNHKEQDPQLARWAAAHERFLQRVLRIDGRDFGNRAWPRHTYPKRPGLFTRPVDPAYPGGDLEPVLGRWGIVPFFHRGPASAWKFATNNARSEEMATKPTFRDALKGRRCIIPADAIFEWTGPEGSKTEHRITRTDGAPLFMAGLWASHSFEGEETESYTMVMQDTAPGDDMHAFHNRQPVFLDAAGATAWLDLTADYRDVLRAPPAGTLAADPPTPAGA